MDNDDRVIKAIAIQNSSSLNTNKKNKKNLARKGKYSTVYKMSSEEKRTQILFSQ